MLEASNLQLHYGKRQILKDISFQAAEGECIGILGVNGCGKSTLLKILAGVLKPDNGRVCFDGADACASSKLFAEYAGYVPQDNPLIEELTVQDNLKLWYTRSKSDINAELHRGVLHMLELESVLKAKVNTLSGGMKKRLSIGCALANRPAVLILDEPAAALDLPCKEEIRGYLKKYLNNRGTVIITTHEEPDLDICNRLFVLRDGRLQAIPSDMRGSQLSALLKS